LPLLENRVDGFSDTDTVLSVRNTFFVSEYVWITQAQNRAVFMRMVSLCGIDWLFAGYITKIELPT
jgi:hypothetical protein